MCLWSITSKSRHRTDRIGPPTTVDRGHGRGRRGLDARAIPGARHGYDRGPSDGRDRSGHAANKLAHARFTLGCPFFAVEVLGSDNICRRHRPGLWNLNILLLENDLAGFAGNCGSPVLPFDGIVGRNPLAGKVPPEFQPLMGLLQAPVFTGFYVQDVLFH